MILDDNCRQKLVLGEIILKACAHANFWVIDGPGKIFDRTIYYYGIKLLLKFDPIAVLIIWTNCLNTLLILYLAFIMSFSFPKIINILTIIFSVYLIGNVNKLQNTAKYWVSKVMIMLLMNRQPFAIRDSTSTAQIESSTRWRRRPKKIPGCHQEKLVPHSLNI